MWVGCLVVYMNVACMYVCMFITVDACVYVCMPCMIAGQSVCVFIAACMYVCSIIYTCIYVHVDVTKCVCMFFLRMRVCMSLCVRGCVHVIICGLACV